MANEQNLIPFKKGFDERRTKKGSTAPRPIIAGLVKEYGYTKKESENCIVLMLAMTTDELKQVFDSKLATILEKSVAHALITALKKGTFVTIDLMMTRIYGSPMNNNTNLNMNMTLNVVTDEETKAIIDRL